MLIVGYNQVVFKLALLVYGMIVVGFDRFGLFLFMHKKNNYKND